MENLHLTPTKTTPLVNFNSSTGILELSGRSIHENPVVFYEPILQWLHHYTKLPAAHTTLIIHLEYFNTTSSKCLLDIFKTTNHLTLTNQSLTIQWKYHPDDEDIKQAGEDYETILGIPFQFVEEE